jgi:hypothetical protein
VKTFLFAPTPDKMYSMSYVKIIMEKQLGFIPDQEISVPHFSSAVDMPEEARLKILEAEMRHHLWEFDGVLLFHHLMTEVFRGESKKENVPKYAIVARDRDGEVFGPVAEFAVFTKTRFPSNDNLMPSPVHYGVKMFQFYSEREIQYLNDSTLPRLFTRFANEFHKTGFSIWNGAEDRGQVFTKKSKLSLPVPSIFT